MIDHLIVMLVVLPIIGAAVPPLASLRFDRVGWAVATATALGHAALAGALAWTVWTDGIVRYEVGGFAAPYGIELVADGLTILLVVLIGAVSLGVLAYARHAGPHANSFYSQFLLLVAGLSGMTVTGDVFNLYVFLEITGLAAYGLVASGRGARSAVAALKYLIIGTIGASLYLLGVGYALAATGTLNMADLSEKLAATGYDSTLVLTAFGLIVAGLLVKVALFPIHTWQPDAYADSPDSVSAFISALVSTVSAYALARVLFSVFTVDFLEAVPIARQALVAVACVSIVAGSALAVAQSDVQRMLAYSSVSQFGLVVAGFAVVNETAALGGLVHLVGHAVMKAGLFVAAGALAAVAGGRTIDDLAGMADRAPIVSAAFATLAFALVGVPPAVGFAGKWHIVLGAAEGGRWIVAGVAVVSTLLTLAYFARVIERLYFRDVPAPAGVAEHPDAAAEAGPDAALTADGSGGAETDAPDSDDVSDADAHSVDAPISTVPMRARLIVVAAAVAAVVLGVFATDLIAVFEPVVEVSFQ